ncbi:MAG: ribosome maturation factor RimM [Bacteroidia bacterium]|jgi:16S rRNA processing protein RimM|nr:16S rRNA processing protein RimM [Bacteroidia bacterium]MCO5255046.1 ribosome maturation factor RimM [Bacteroidota bacterium]MCZ2129803.1 ribosome maturation factor RimM [Bacteroidia bacterium]
MSNRLTANIHSKPTQKVGFIVKAHGFKGAVKIAVDSDDIFNAITQSGFMLLKREGRWVPYKIESYNADNEYIKLEDINSEKEAQSIAGLDIQIHTSDLPDNQEIDYHNFIGLELFNQNNERIGIIKELIQMPMHDLLDIEMENKSILVPIHHSLIIDVDHSLNRLVLEMHEGLTDL